MTNTVPPIELLDRIIRKHHPELEGKRAYAGEIYNEFMGDASNRKDEAWLLNGNRFCCEPKDIFTAGYQAAWNTRAQPDAVEKIREALAIAFYNVHVPCSHTDSHGWHTYCHTLADIAIDTIIAKQKATEEALRVAVEGLQWLRKYIHEYCIIIHPKKTLSVFTPEEQIMAKIEETINTILKEPTE